MTSFSFVPSRTTKLSMNCALRGIGSPMNSCPTRSEVETIWPTAGRKVDGSIQKSWARARGARDAMTTIAIRFTWGDTRVEPGWMGEVPPDVGSPFWSVAPPTRRRFYIRRGGFILPPGGGAPQTHPPTLNGPAGALPVLV